MSVANCVARILAGVVLLTAGAGGVRGEASPPLPLPPNQPLAEGRPVFEAKGCGECHSVWGDKTAREGAPDLGRDGSWNNIMQLSGVLWNHTPVMVEKLHGQQAAPSPMSPDEMGKVAAYLFYVRFLDAPGSVERGRQLFAQRSCAQCHQLEGRGGTVGPRLDELRAYASSFFLAQALWNHGPEMTAKMAALKMAPPSLEGTDVADLVAYLRGGSRTGTPLELAYAQAGSPQQGQALFRDKGCIKCHAIDGAGGNVGPDLGRRRPHEHVAQLAAALWDHGPTMWAKMKENGVAFPKLNDREMADLLAYLNFVQYVDGPGDAQRGSALFRAKACAQCHAVGGDGPKIGPDLAASPALQSSFSWAAAMWNHAAAMAHTAHDTKLPWLRFDDDEMRDVVAFLLSRHGSQ